MQTRRAPLKSSLLDELARAKKTANLFDWLKNETHRLAKINYNGTYVELGDRILSHFNVEKITVADKGSPMGTLTCVDRRYRIQLSSVLKLPDRRFVLAHELAHTWWLRDGSSEPLSARQSPFIDPDIEYLCDLAASYLLCPDFCLVANKVSPTGFGDAIERTSSALANAYKASKSLQIPFSAVLQRLMESASATTYSLTTFKIQQKQHSESAKPRLTSRDSYYRALDSHSASPIVLRKKVHISMTQTDERLSKLKTYGPLDDLCSVFEMSDDKRLKFAQGAQFNLVGEYHRLPDFVVVVMQAPELDDRKACSGSA